MKERLLVLELHHLGDAVMAIPFLRAAQARFAVAVYATPATGRMLRTFLPDLEIVEAAPSWPERFRQASGLARELAPAATVCAWSDARAEIVARLTGARQRVGFPMNATNYYASERAWRKRRLFTGQLIEQAARLAGGKLLTVELQRKSGRDSHFSNWMLAAGVLNLTMEVTPPWFVAPEVTLPADIQLFMERQRAVGKPLWVLHPGGRLPTKRWPRARFQTVLREVFAARSLPVLILNPPGEDTLEPVGDEQRSLLCQSHTELAAALLSADAILCNDSYPAHLAAALGKRVFAIFGSGEPAWFSPYGNGQRVIQTDICPHHPCVDRCVMPSVVCLEAVSVEQVAGKVAEALAGN